MWLYRVYVLIACVSAYQELLDDDDDNNKVTKQTALLVEDSVDNFKDVQDFLLAGNRLNSSDYWLITFNSTGVSTVWEMGTNANILKHLQTSSTDNDTSSSSVPMFAILQTAEILPKNSTIIIFSELTKYKDGELENIALRTLLKKNISIYTVSDQPKDINSKLFQKITQYSDDRSFHLKNLFENYQSTDIGNISVILSRKQLRNMNELIFPIDETVRGIHITISPSSTTKGSLLSPSGYHFAFSNKTKTNQIRYSSGSIFENENQLFEMHLNFSNSHRLTTGLWTLTLENYVDLYDVSVFACTELEAKVNMDRKVGNVKLGVTGGVSHISDISVLNVNGEPLLRNISYKINNDRQKYVTEIDKTEELDLTIMDRLVQPHYALIRGKDVKGNQFQRLSYLFNNNDLYPLQTISIEVGLGSSLYISSSTTSEIYFEVKNLASDARYFSFKCIDSKGILQLLSTFKRYLESQQSTVVVLRLNPVYGSYSDEITFIATAGSDVVQKTIIVTVGSHLYDAAAPSIHHKLLTRCSVFHKCSDQSWSVEISVTDSGSGLLRLSSHPQGLSFPLSYKVGTNQTVVSFYSESCCNAWLEVEAVDRMNNIQYYTINPYEIYLTPGEIAAIILGILLFLAIVALIGYFIWKCCHSRGSVDLPTYKGRI